MPILNRFRGNPVVQQTPIIQTVSSTSSGAAYGAQKTYGATTQTFGREVSERIR